MAFTPAYRPHPTVAPEGIRDVRPTANHLRRSAAGLAGAACLLLVSACGTNFDAQTGQVYQPAAGANQDTEQIKMLNVVAVDNADNTATLSASLLNKADEADAISGVTGTNNGDAIDVELVEPIELPPHELVKTGEEAQVVVAFDDLQAGYYVKLDFEFESAAPIEVNVPIASRDDAAVYEGIAEAPETPEPKNGSGNQSGNNNQG